MTGVPRSGLICWPPRDGSAEVPVDLVSEVRPASPANWRWKAVETRKSLGLGGRGPAAKSSTTWPDRWSFSHLSGRDTCPYDTNRVTLNYTAVATPMQQICGVVTR